MAPPNDNSLRLEPPDHGIGRDRGGLASQIHHLVYGRGAPMVVAVSAGQAGDWPMLPVVAPDQDWLIEDNPGPVAG